MQVRATHVPADLKGYINDAISQAPDDFTFAYLNNVLKYSDSEEEHVANV